MDHETTDELGISGNANVLDMMAGKLWGQETQSTTICFFQVADFDSLTMCCNLYEVISNEDVQHL